MPVFRRAKRQVETDILEGNYEVGVAMGMTLKLNKQNRGGDCDFNKI